MLGGFLAQPHRLFQIGDVELDHHGVRVAVDDVRVRGVAVRGVVPLQNQVPRLVDHVAAEGCRGGGNLEARQRAHCRAREPVHAVRGNLQRQLATVQHSLLQRVLRFLQVRLGALARAEQLLENLGEDALGFVRAHEHVAGGRLGEVRLRQPPDGVRGHERAVAQVVRHHDGRVQRREVQRRDRHLVVPRLGVQHGRALERDAALRLVALPLLGHVRYEQAPLRGFAQDLRHHLDGLPAREQEGQRHAGDARHLDVVVHVHQLVKQTLRQVRVLQAVHR